MFIKTQILGTQSDLLTQAFHGKGLVICMTVSQDSYSLGSLRNNTTKDFCGRDN